MGKRKICKCAVLVGLLALFYLLNGRVAAQTPIFTKIVVFGDSLSDDGNVAHRVRDALGFSYPSSNPEFNYSDYRFTNDTYTDPGSQLYSGVWHEQLARDFLHLPVARNSLDGGFDYAFGGATTEDGTQNRTIIGNPTPFGGGQYSITIDNIGKQVNDFISGQAVDSNALYAIWGGGNDLFDDASAGNVTAAAARVGALIERLANAGARYFIVPNVPPLGAVPNSFGNPDRVSSLDSASASYRNQLNAVLASTKSSLAASGITIQVYALDVWLDVIRILAQPGAYGFTNVTDTAQGRDVNPDTYLFWDDIHPTTAGHHQIAGEANRLVSGQIAPLGRATNISTRGFTGTGEDVLIGGFIITGSVPKQVIVRALGPSLTNLHVAGALPDPTLAIYNSSNVAIAFNDNWRTGPQAKQISADGYAPQNELDSAVLLTLAPGSYTAVVSGKNGVTGIALAEVYDLDTSANSTLYNVSTRGFVGTGDNVLIGGFIVGTGEPPVVVVRAIGPALASHGIAHPLLDPTVQLYDANGMLLDSNDNWKDAQPTALKATLLAPPNDGEAAIIASLPAGSYTAIVRGKNGATGVALVEAYRVH